MKVFVGSDHNGFSYKANLIAHLKNLGHEVLDDAETRLNPDDDYPIFARRVTSDILKSTGSESRGILICGSGQGICMAANRFKGIRAVLGYDHESVRSARNDDDANILCLGTNVLDNDPNFNLVDTFLNTPFAAATRYMRRIKEMDEF